MLSFLRKEQLSGDDARYVFIGEKMEIYLPVEYFDKSTDLATVMGGKISTFGVFLFKVFPSETSKNGALYSMSIPVYIKFSFSNVETKRLKLINDLPQQQYRVFTLYKGDTFIDSVIYEKSGKTVYNFIAKIVHGGKIPKTVRYDQSLKLYLDTLSLNGQKLGVPSVILEMILSELYRSKRDVSKPFRMHFDNKQYGPFDYKMIRITKIPEMVSVFTGLASDDINHKIVAAILRTKEGKKDIPSPIEKVLKY